MNVSLAIMYQNPEQCGSTKYQPCTGTSIDRFRPPISIVLVTDEVPESPQLQQLLQEPKLSLLLVLFISLFLFSMKMSSSIFAALQMKVYFDYQVS